jgi:hypothetical protein
VLITHFFVELPEYLHVLFLVLLIILLIQTAVLLPKLDKRAKAQIAGDIVPASKIHLIYVLLEGSKMILLLITVLLFLTR